MFLFNTGINLFFLIEISYESLRDILGKPLGSLRNPLGTLCALRVDRLLVIVVVVVAVAVAVAVVVAVAVSVAVVVESSSCSGSRSSSSSSSSGSSSHGSEHSEALLSNFNLYETGHSFKI